MTSTPEDPEAGKRPPDGRERPAGAPVRRGSGWHAWAVLGVTLAGSYLVVLNTTVLGVALPDIARDLGRGPVLDADWVLTTYLLAVLAVQPATAWLADRWGHKAVYIGALTSFTIGSLLCALAPTLPVLLATRAVQGAGGGALMPLGAAMVFGAFPPRRRGLALGVHGMAVMGGPALGPPVGGILVTQGSWRMIFAALVPFAVVATVLALSVLRDPGVRDNRPFDAGGWLLAFTGVTLVVVGARQAGVWGLASPVILATLLSGAAALALLVRRSLRRPRPLLEVRLLAVPTFGLSLAMVWLVTTIQFARLSFLPVELQVVRGLSAQDVGLILAPTALGMGMTMPFSGWLADRVGARGPMLAGLTVMCATAWQFAHLTPGTPVARIVVLLLLQGMGTGLMRIPVNVSGMNAVENRFITQASVLRSLNRMVASTVTTAALAAMVIAQLGAIAPDVTGAREIARAQAAYNRLFLVAFYLLVAAVVGALFMPGRRRTRQILSRRAQEYRAERAQRRQP